MNKLIILFFIPNLCFAESNNYQEAQNKALEAYYIQSGIKNNINNRLDILKEKVPKEYRNKLDLVLPLIDLIIKQKIEVKYEF